MQVHTFISESANDAVEQIRSQLGPSAVVLSVRKLPPSGLSRIWSSGQIEVMAAVPEETQAGSVESAEALAELRSEIRELKEQVSKQDTGVNDAVEARFDTEQTEERNGWRVNRFLVQAGLLPLYAEQICDHLASAHGPAPINLARQIELAQNALRSHWQKSSEVGATTHIFIGPAGAGKSTVLCKWLAQTILAGGEKARVCQLDTHIANASSLPALYSEILGARFSRALPEKCEEENELLFIDLPGVSAQSHRPLLEISKVIRSFSNAEIHLVLNGAYESTLLLEQARFFSALPLSDIILTHLDEETRWGKIWNLVMGTTINLRYFSAGQNIPGEFIAASPDQLFAGQIREK